MPPAWKVMTYASVVLIIFGTATVGFGRSLSDTALLATLAMMFVTVAIGYRIGQSFVTDPDEE